jgi:hypothetical protein
MPRPIDQTLAVTTPSDGADRALIPLRSVESFQHCLLSQGFCRVEIRPLFRKGTLMVMEIYIWLWTRFDPKACLKKAARRLGLAALFIVPLIFANFDLIKRGFHPSEPGPTVHIGQPSGIVEVDENDH